jgi:FAD/FMN-containing dehydrogenase
MRNLPLFCIFCLFLIVVANALIDVSHQATETSMPSFRTIDSGTAELSSSTLDSFASRFRGALIREKDDGYDGARRVWNCLIDKRPALIARCSGVADVVEAIDLARQRDLLLAVRGGGHNVSGSAVCDGGLVIDLSAMHAVHVDQTARTVRVEGGATLADIDRETQRFGLATTTGNVSKTGIAGLTLSGGFGNLRRKFGLGVDNLLSAEVVTADGAVVRTDASTNSDLFWAVRGGGGNFGVVTSFEFQLHQLGPEVMFAAQFFSIGQAREAFRRWRDCMSDARDEISSIAFFWTVPLADPFPEELRGGRVFLYGALYAGPAEEGEKALAPVMKIGTPILDLSGRGPYTQWQQAFDPFFTPGSVYPRLYAYWKSLYLHGLDDALIDDLVGRARELPSEQCLIAIWQLGGAPARVPETATAFGRRSAPFLLSYDSCWTDPNQNDHVIAWTREQIAAAEPYSPGGSYLNFPGVGEDNESLVRKAYGSNYERLAQIKRIYDPRNLFRMNQNIVPAA